MSGEGVRSCSFDKRVMRLVCLRALMCLFWIDRGYGLGGAMGAVTINCSESHLPPEIEKVKNSKSKIKIKNQN